MGMKDLRNAEDILEYFSQQDLDNESRIFLRYHFRRYEFLLQIVDRMTQKWMENHQRPIKILDIGPGFQTEILRKTLPNAIINTLGFQDIRFQLRPQDQHFEFDLNNAQFQEKWLKLEPHDLLIFAEVIEHLYTSPALALKCLTTWMAPDGYLIMQTPNACSLHKRIKMLVGINPYDLIREDPTNSGHFREYTLSELQEYARGTGLRVVEQAYCNYFDNGSRMHRVYNTVSQFMPSSLRQGITLTLQKI